MKSDCEEEKDKVMELCGISIPLPSWLEAAKEENKTRLELQGKMKNIMVR